MMAKLNSKRKSSRSNPKKEADSVQGRWFKIGFLGVFGASLLLAIVFIYDSSSARRSTPDTIESAKIALNENDFEIAEALSNSVGEVDPLFSQSRLIAGEAATRMGRLDDALEYYRKIDSSSDEYGTGIYAQGEILRTLCRWDPAVAAYRQVLNVRPTQFDCMERLAFLLGVSGQRWESAPLLLQLVKEKRWSIESLTILTDIEHPIEQLDLVKHCQEIEPNDQLVRLARAAHHLIDGEPELGRKILESLTKANPNFLAAQEQLGESLFMLNDWESLQRWSQSIGGAVFHDVAVGIVP